MEIKNIKERILGLKEDKSDRLTMLQPRILDNIEYCIWECQKNNIDGDFVETGVWKGGAVILAYNLYKKLGQKRKVYAYDSFEGLPRPNPNKYPIDEGDIHWSISELSISLEEVKSNFEIFSPIDESVIFVKGWFRDTIPLNTIEKISILRLDGDMYESTIDVLDYLYPKLSIGGFCIIDDFAHKGANSAVMDYREKHGISDKIHTIDPSGDSYPSSYWIKSN
jgi:O-methyltransferase